MQEKEKAFKYLFMICASAGVISITIMTIFIFSQGLGFFDNNNLINFFFGKVWQPLKGIYGIFPFILGSVLVTITSVLISLPISVATALAMSEYAPRKVAGLIRQGVELLAGIPSVIFGFFGMMVLVPFLRISFGGSGYSLFAASVILAIMILPTLVNISADSLRSVPPEYREASLSLGATKWQTIKRMVLPSAKRGIWTAVVLGIGRAIGETMAVIMVVGNATNIPESLLAPARTLTGNIALEMGYASGEHQQALFATGIVLFVFIMLINGFL